MDKWSEIRAKLVDAQEELYQIGDQYRQSRMIWIPSGAFCMIFIRD